MSDPDVVHTYPSRDLIEHVTEGDGCVCGPTLNPVPRGDGSIGWHLIHHSLDGREYTEHDHTGPPMKQEGKPND